MTTPAKKSRTAAVAVAAPESTHVVVANAKSPNVRGFGFGAAEQALADVLGVFIAGAAEARISSAIAKTNSALRLPSQIGEQNVRYRTVRLRETTVADEFAAVELAERIVSIQGKPTLLVSDELYRVALTLRHVERFECAELDPIDRKLLTLDMFGRLSPLDLARIEERCMLVDLAAQLRHGLVTQADFDAMLAGEKEPSGPRSEGQTDAVGDAGASAQSGPAMLADFGTQSAAVAAGGADR